MIYYNPRDAKADKKHPSGLIYDRFHNRNKKRLLKVPKETESNFQEAKYAALHLSEDGKTVNVYIDLYKISTDKIIFDVP